MEFSFITWEELLTLHEDQLRLYGGQNGFVDEGVVRSAMNRPLFRLQYDAEADMADMAAEYLFGLATTQGFLDGNKRTALVAALYFLEKNCWDVTFNDRLMFVVAIAVAKGDLDRDGLADILRSHMVPLDENDVR
jgi:death on curing protein